MSTAIWWDLFRFEPILLVRYRWPQPQASEDGPGPISLVLQKHPIRGVWAEAQVYSAWFCSFSVASDQLQLFWDKLKKLRKFKTKIRLQSSDLKYMLKRGNILVPTHPIGNIPTLCQKEISRQNCTTGNIPTSKKAVGIFPVGQQEMSWHNFGQQEMSRQQKTLSGYFLLGNRKCSDSCRDISYCPTVLAGGSRFAPNFIQNIYTVLKKIVGISQYAYFRTCHSSRAATRACSLIYSFWSMAAGQCTFVRFPATVRMHAVWYPATELQWLQSTGMYSAVTMLLWQDTKLHA
jgi:hypothetical protein